MENKGISAEISKKISIGGLILLWVFIGIQCIILLFWFLVGKLGMEFVYILFSIEILTMVLFFLWVLVGVRRRSLSSLTVNEKEIVGSYTAFIPIAKITLKMPIEKIDNISAVNSFFFLYTGKALRIGYASSVIKIPYVLNADEIVEFILAAIEKAKNRPIKPIAVQENPQTDAMDSLKKLAELRDSGIINEEEFNQKKNELLGKI